MIGMPLLVAGYLGKGKVAFGCNSERLDSGGLESVSLIGQRVAQAGNCNALVVEGHASGRGPASYNLDLAER